MVKYKSVFQEQETVKGGIPDTAKGKVSVRRSRGLDLQFKRVDAIVRTTAVLYLWKEHEAAERRGCVKNAAAALNALSHHVADC